MRRLRRRYRSLQSDLQALLNALEEGHQLGDRIQGLDVPVYKVRVKNSDAQRGKSGGYRVIYYLVSADHVTLLAMYSKSDRADMDASTIKRILDNLD